MSVHPKFKLRGLCVCGHDPEEDPNEDCERCWLITLIDDLTMQSIAESDQNGDLRTELAAVTADRDRLREEVIQARNHTVSYAEYLREYHWPNMADEFDELKAKLNKALAATEPKGE